MNFYKMLEMIQKRPGLYLRSPSVLHLDSYLRGYFLAKSAMGVVLSPEEVEFDNFQEWTQERLEMKANQSWANIIFFYSVSEQNSLDIFFELLEEFKSSRRNDES
ncbi:hypothetical protein IQ249_04940 [Lusitaniella coriacea LEGE 07157]|uniref:Uncharacterized protein n=1 Tax=Lusitaniella coriacea LEGE 07157 TaxID=945747 RepID=A0A8J7AX93_9CYAN|nr:hypothetical protein [Lusitaniella coriacea]MBE9115242.1 hypothetical protein [Lusitaniella coriacea LEGE 07157]